MMVQTLYEGGQMTELSYIDAVLTKAQPNQDSLQ